MIRAVLLDAGPLSLAANPRLSPTTRACRNWLDLLRQFGISILIPEIADYEVRRELIRARKRKALLRLDELAMELVYLPITTTAMRRAAELWAQVRHVGQPTAADDTIDADMILVAQAEATGIFRSRHRYFKRRSHRPLLSRRALVEHRRRAADAVKQLK